MESKKYSEISWQDAKRARKSRYKAKREWWERIKKPSTEKQKENQQNSTLVSDSIYRSEDPSSAYGSMFGLYYAYITTILFGGQIFGLVLFYCSIGFGFIGGDVVIESPNKDISGEEKEKRWSIMYIMYIKIAVIILVVKFICFNILVVKFFYYYTI